MSVCEIFPSDPSCVQTEPIEVLEEPALEEEIIEEAVVEEVVDDDESLEEPKEKVNDAV